MRGATPILMAAIATAAFQVSVLTQKIPYPSTRTVDVVDDYHGTKVADPYRWLEDLDSRETAEWVAAQNRVTDRYLAQFPIRETFRRRIQRLWNFRKTNLPVAENGRLFYRADRSEPDLARRHDIARDVRALTRHTPPGLHRREGGR